MKRFALLLTLLLLGAGVASAQVPKTINYQGRAQSNGTPLQGNHNIVIKLYTDSVGGTALWSEPQDNIRFTDGVFSVVIGKLVKLPVFTRTLHAYWVGVTIQGINGGNEVAPRLRLSSTPYSLYSELADSAAVSESAVTAKTAQKADTSTYASQAKNADTSGTAKSLQAPITITNTNGSKSTVVTITNSAGGTALVTNGVDSSSQYFVAGANLGPTGKPVAGGYYRDNAPAAWGTYDPARGGLISKFGVDSISVQTDAGGVFYEIYLSSTFQNGVCAPTITGSSNVPLLPVWIQKQGTSSTVLQVKLYRIIDVPPSQIAGAFSFVVYGRQP